MPDQLSADLASLKIDRKSPANRKRYLGWLAAFMVVGLLVVGYQPAVSLLRSQVLKTEINTTSVIRVSAAQADIELTSTGYVVPQRVTKVGVKLPGRVSAVHVEQGDRVERGAALVELEKADHMAAVRTAQAAVSAAQARVHTARAQLSEIKLQAKRQRGLADRGVVPTAQAEDLEARVLSLGETVKAAEAEVKSARAQVAALRVNLGYMTLRAPMAGTVTSRPPQVGEVLNFEIGSLGGSLIEIADYTSMMVEIDVPESRLGRVRVGAPCEIVLDAFPDRRFRGIAETILPEVNRAKATVGVKVKFVDDMQGVLPQMSARVSFLGQALDETKLRQPPKTVVPSAAVAERNGGKVVFVVEGGLVHMRSVQLGAPIAGGFELVSGPAPGTQLVSEPSDQLKDGQRVKQRGAS